MKQSPLNVRIPEKLKQEATHVLEGIGLTPSSAVRMFFAQIVNRGGIPFQIKKQEGKKNVI